MMRTVELLSPAGDLERLKMAVAYGADAVYMAGKEFGMRAGAANFSDDELADAISYCHSKDVKVYITCNTLPHDSELVRLPEFLGFLNEAGADAVIAADFGVLQMVRKYAPSLKIHISTQFGVVNSETANALYSLGADTVVLARELKLSEIKEIRRKTPEELRLECFVHGSMCVSFSGRCLLSNYLTGRDSNRGNCAQPCRWKYRLVEETRPGEYFPVVEDNGTYIFNSKDLCMIEHVPEMMDAGIDSFKIEGRMKTALYVATVARTYRKAIDAAMESQEAYEAMLPWCREEISKCTYRQFTTGFYFGKPDENTQIYDSNTYEQEYIYLGIAEGVKQTETGCEVSIEQRNKFSVGETIEIMKPDGRNVEVTVVSIRNEDGQEQESAPHPQQKLTVTLSDEAEKYDILRKKGKRA